MFTSIVLFTSLIWLHGILIFRVHILCNRFCIFNNRLYVFSIIFSGQTLSFERFGPYSCQFFSTKSCIFNNRLHIFNSIVDFSTRFCIFNNRVYIFNNRLILKLTNLGIIYISNFIFSFSLSIFFFSISYYYSPIRPINIVNLFRLHISSSILNFRAISFDIIFFSNVNFIFSYCIFNFRLSYLAITLSRIFMILPHYHIAIFASIYIRNTILITIISTWCKTKLSWTHYASSLAFFK